MSESTDGLIGLDGQPFNMNQAREALRALVSPLDAIPDEMDKPISGRMARLIESGMPRACFVLGKNGPQDPYVPATLLKEAARLVFRDRWTTTVLSHEILADKVESVRFESRAPEKRIQRIMVSARVRVVVRAPLGREQAHEGFGLSVVDAETGSTDLPQIYKMVHKGAETDALCTALALFGPLFVRRGEEQEEQPAQAPTATAQAPVLQPVRRLSRGPAVKQPLPLAKADGSEGGSFANTAQGGQAWIEAFIALMQEATDEGRYMRLQEQNATTIEEIEKTWRPTLDASLARMRAVITNRAADLLGVGAPVAVPDVPKLRRARRTKAEMIAARAAASAASAPDPRQGDLVTLAEQLAEAEPETATAKPEAAEPVGTEATPEALAA